MNADWDVEKPICEAAYEQVFCLHLHPDDALRLEARKGTVLGPF